MFKRTFLMAIAFISMMVFASTASAQTTIYGCLDKVYMNKDKNPVHQNDVSPALNTLDSKWRWFVQIGVV